VLKFAASPKRPRPKDALSALRSSATSDRGTGVVNLS
jgi:hypothetical protein